MTWATNHDASVENLRRTQGSLAVKLIMVPRGRFETCVVQETATSIQRRNELKFSFFPVTDEEGRILGLYDAERWFQQDAPEIPINDDYLTLSEDILIGADASILDFVMQADQHPTNLVVSGSQIAGLVSLSDIQQLPVRAALFSAITSFEMAMSLLVQLHWNEAGDWMDELSDGRLMKLKDKIAEAKKRDGYVSEIALTDFCDKACLVLKSDLLERPSKKLKKDLNSIERLRNKVAHADTFANTPESAKKVCKTVRSLIALKSEIIAILETTIER